MEDGVKTLPPRTLVASTILSLVAFYWNYGGALTTPGSLGFYAFTGWSLFLLASLFWPNALTIAGVIWWTIAMSLGALPMLMIAIYRSAGDEIVHATLFLLFQWGAAVFLFQGSTLSWLFLGGYAPQDDADDDEDDGRDVAYGALEAAEADKLPG